MDWREEERKERRLLLLVWRTGYYTFLNTHIHHAGAHHLNEVILVFLIRLIINYLDVNCFAVDGKIKYHKQRGRIGARLPEKKQEEKERERDPERSKLAQFLKRMEEGGSPGPSPASVSSPGLHVTVCYNHT